MAEQKADEAIKFESQSLNLICIDSSKHSYRALECKMFLASYTLIQIDNKISDCLWLANYKNNY